MLFNAMEITKIFQGECKMSDSKKRRGTSWGVGRERLLKNAIIRRHRTKILFRKWGQGNPQNNCH